VNFEALVNKMRERATRDRKLMYQEGALGITALLYCPIKQELREEYPEVVAESADVDDGLIFEKEVKESLKELYGDKVMEEFDLMAKVGNQLIHGHLDALVVNDDELVGIEIKAPRKLLVKRGVTIPKDKKIIYDDGSLFLHSETYLKQARIQKAILQRMFKDKKVKVFLFYKTLIGENGKTRRAFVVYEVGTPATIEEIEELVRAFHEIKEPRYDWECDYCEFGKRRLCPKRAKGDAGDIYDLI